jgi:hypothetical protein
VVKAHARTELDHSRSLGRCQGVDRNPQLRSGAQKQRGIANRLGRSDK